MAKIKCPRCAEKIDLQAQVCKHCGHERDPVERDAAIAKDRKDTRTGCIAGIVLVVVLSVLASTCGSDEGTGNATAAKVSDEPAAVTAAKASDQNRADVEKNTADDLTGPQRNAVRSAEQYLSMSGFSRRGLIGQLSSDAGEGYSVEDATAAVDSLTVDWNENAARSAKSYLEMTGFSCKGLIQQLSSASGDKYTVEQATFGARQAGAC